MKRTHALYEKAALGAALFLFIAALVTGGAKLKGLREPEDAGLLRKLEEGAEFAPIPAVKKEEVLKELGSGYRPVIEYLKIADRNPFARFEPRVVKGAFGEAPAEEEERAAYIYRGMATVGAVVRAILEDAQSQEVYFVAQDAQVGDFKVLDIAQDAVILSGKGGEEISIKLAE
ncbi:MAG: hypothetical protein HYY14_04965 [Candidatus Omnitrophica bacterium]|nr:hypothetical protein [Candidatus Omnitrophota bacterium]